MMQSDCSCAFSLHANVAPDQVGGGQLAWLFDSVIQDYGNKVVKGGMFNVARAYEIRGDATGKIAARSWDDAKEPYADHVIDLLTEHYIPNLKATILKRVVHSPVDQERLTSSAVHGTELQGAFLPYQSGAMRPIPELAQYRAPIPNVYLCGAGSHPGPGVSFMPGRNAAQVIFRDLGLDFRSVVVSH